MKIFICWSRGRSQTLAGTLDEWLPRVVHGLDPFLSSEIEKGRRWFEEISAALTEAQSGLVCLTPECLHAPWIHFEAGALAHAVGDRLYPYLHGVRPEQLLGPLSAFQATQATRDDTFNLVSALQRSATPTFEESAVKARFEAAWPDLEAVRRGLDAVTIEAALPGFVELFKVKTFTEPMRECPDFGWIARHERLARVDAILEKGRNEVAALGRPHLLHLYDELRRQLDLTIGSGRLAMTCGRRPSRLPLMSSGTSRRIPRVTSAGSSPRDSRRSGGGWEADDRQRRQAGSVSREVRTRTSPRAAPGEGRRRRDAGTRRS